jgi:GR25 family glycosyltransferase involved in LPS biosynthesis
MDPRQLSPQKRIYEKTLYPTPWGASRSTDSYLLSQKAAQQLSAYIESHRPIGATIGWWLNEAARHYKMKAYWAEPTLVTQGSQNGRFKSMH